MKPIESSTCIQAWLAAVQHLITQPERRDYNVILEVADPITVTDSDNRIYDRLDSFLKQRDGVPLSTVANTIFPLGFYRQSGAKGIYEEYPAAYPSLRKHPDANWGTYAIRMLRRPGKKGEDIRPLEYLVEKLKKQLSRTGPARAAYELNLIDPLLELPIYSAVDDRHRPIGGPCLSHLSFKVTAGRQLILTALYRSHYYVQRSMGNLIGLAQLQGFVAEEAQVEVGPLVCISTMATLETDKKWGTRDVEKLVEECLSVCGETPEFARK